MPRGRLGVRDVRRRRRASASRATCARRASRSPTAFAEGARACGHRGRRPRHGLDGLPVLRRRATSTAPARCSPRRTTPRSTTASSCASPGAKPVGRGERARRDQGADRRGSSTSPPRRAARGTRRRSTCSTRWADHVRGFVDTSVLRPLHVVARHGQRHGRPRRARSCSTPLPFEVDVPLPRARRHLPEPPRRPDPAREPRRPPGARCSSAAPTSGWPSTATPTASSSSTSTAAGVSGSLTTALVAVVDAAQVPGLDGPLQPHLLEGRPRDGDRARRDTDPHAGRAQLHQAGDGRDRRGLRRRALRALLLPRQLPRRLGHHHRAARPRADVRRAASRSPSSSRRSGATRTRASATPRSPTRARSSSAMAAAARGHGARRSTGSTGSPWTTATGGSTCGRRNTEPLLRLNVEAADERSLEHHTNASARRSSRRAQERS